MLAGGVAGRSRDPDLASRHHDPRRAGRKRPAGNRNYGWTGPYLGRNRKCRRHHGRSRSGVSGNLRQGLTMSVTQSSSQSREWNSSEYHRLSGPQVTWGKKVLARLHLRGNELLLDAGCGTGRLTAELLQALPNGRVVALDISQN